MADIPDYNFLSQDTTKSPQDYITGWQQVQKNALEIQQQQANQAIGGILQQSTDANGNVDYEKAGQLAAAAGPRVQMGMQEYLKNASQLRGQQLAQGSARNTAVGNAIIGALNGDDAGLHDRVVSGLQGLVTNGVMTQDQATREALSLPNDAPSLRQRLQQYQTSLAPADLQQQQISGRMGSQTGPGGVTIGTRQDINTGAISSPPQQGAPQGLSAEAAAERTRWLQSPRDYPDPADPNTTKHGTNETFLRDSGVPSQYIYTGGAPASPGSQPSSSPLGTGRLPSTLLNPNKPQSAPAAAPPSAPTSTAGTGIRGPTPAQAASGGATIEQGKLSPPRFQAEADADTQAQNQQAILGTMLSDLTKFQSGSGAQKTLDLKRALTSWAPNVAKSFGVKPDEVAGQESFDKLANQLALQQQGGITDHRMDVNAAANPHSSLSPEGADFIIRTLQGNSDYIRARASLASKYPNKADYPGFQQSVKDLDPRVFQLARMTEPQRQTYWKSLDDQTQKQLGSAIQKAKDLGVLGG